MASVWRISLTGHLTRPRLEAALGTIESELTRSAQPLLVDCRHMTGYDADARGLFVEWNARQRRRLKLVAVLTANPFWPVLVSAMALASGQRMRAFGDERSAIAWVTDARAELDDR